MQPSTRERELVSHYELHECLGAGGMGVVYRATDTILRRVVALKFPAGRCLQDPLAKARFLREAQAASALDHPNIGTVYEVGEEHGQAFIVMAYYQGETLHDRLRRGPLPIPEAISVAAQLAAALSIAHAAGIVHRDLKPANVMIGQGGLVKLVDFGIAKLVDALESADISLTDEGELLGTVAYMSPEQANGRAVDQRTDLFSLGVVIHEMLTGQHPFAASTKVATLTRILHETPTALNELRPDAPPALVRLVQALLQKDPQHRPRSAAQVIDTLQTAARMDAAPSFLRIRRRHGVSIATRFGEARKLRFGAIAVAIVTAVIAALFLHRGGPRPAALDSIAVMPFTNADASAETEYLGDSVSNDLISTLSKLPNVKVISRSATARYVGKDIDPREVGRSLGVRTILSGRIRQSGDQLGIDAELVETANGRQIWGQQYLHMRSDLSEIRRALVRDIAKQLRIELTNEEQARLVQPPTDNAEAYRLYLKGRYYLNSRLNADRSREFFERAIEKDPMYALAYAGLADSYASPVGVRALLPPDFANRRAKAAAEKAIEIDPTLGQAHVALGNANLTYDWNWDAAEKNFRRAIELNPNDSNARHRYSHFLIAMKRFEESLAQSKKAIEIDPLDPNLVAHLGFHYKTARRPDLAIDICLQAIKLNPNARVGYFYLAEAYVQKGLLAEAMALIDGMPASVKSEIAATPGVTGFGHVYAAAGRTKEARESIALLESVAKTKTNATYRLARNHAALGEIDEALAWLEQAYRDRAPVLMDLEVDPVLDPVRSDPRYHDLVQRIGFPR